MGLDLVRVTNRIPGAPAGAAAGGGWLAPLAQQLSVAVGSAVTTGERAVASILLVAVPDDSAAQFCITFAEPREAGGGELAVVYEAQPQTRERVLAKLTAILRLSGEDRRVVRVPTLAGGPGK